MPDRNKRAEDERAIVAGRRPVVELLNSGTPLSMLMLARELRDAPIVRRLKADASRSGVPIKVVPKSEIEKIASGLNHQGVVARVGRYRYTPLEDVLRGRFVLFLDGITDPHNLGSLLRSADGAGFSGVVVPAHRAAGVTPTVRKVSAGAAEVVPVARVTNLGRAVDEARGAGFWIVGLDETAETELWGSDALDPPVGLVLGSEGTGMSRSIRERCDALLKIPSGGRLASLNVAVAGAIAMFEATRRPPSSDTL